MSYDQYSDLLDFIRRQMRMQAVYQPVLIRTLLQHGGRSSVSVIAGEIQSEDNGRLGNQLDYEQIVRKLPGRVLSDRGCLTYIESLDQYQLNIDVGSLSAQELDNLIMACEDRISSYLSNERESPVTTNTRYWWVNQNKTYRFEVPGNYMWSPKRNVNGAFNQFYENMQEVAAGDMVFSFTDTLIKAVGIVQRPAETRSKPTEFQSVENQWDSQGWYVFVHFWELNKPIRPKDHMEFLGPTLPYKYSPLQANGNGKQAVYLAEVPFPMVVRLIALLEGQVEAIIQNWRVEHLGIDDQNDNHEGFIDQRSDISETEKSQLVMARRGQGLFRSRVAQIEKSCRLTGTTSPQHLRASHIKPWRQSTDQEKLDGYNGLLLSPHVDHLFDRGYISFDTDGSLMISPMLQNEVLLAWNISPGINVGTFNSEQEIYLQFHRTEVFKR